MTYETRAALGKTALTLFIIACVSPVASCSFWGSTNVDSVKERAADVWADNGFEVVGYEGYRRSICWFDYGCGRVWYTATNDSGIVYHGFVERWGDEYHLYNLSAVDAIKP